MVLVELDNLDVKNIFELWVETIFVYLVGVKRVPIRYFLSVSVFIIEEVVDVIYVTFDVMDIVEELGKFEAKTCGVEELEDFVIVPEEECVVLLVLVEFVLVGDINATVEVDIEVGEENMLDDFMVVEKIVAIDVNFVPYGNILLALTNVEEVGFKVIEGVDFVVIGIMIALVISAIVIVIGVNILVLVEDDIEDLDV